MLITGFFLIRSLGYREPPKEVGSQSLVERNCGIQIEYLSILSIALSHYVTLPSIGLLSRSVAIKSLYQ